MNCRGALNAPILVPIRLAYLFVHLLYYPMVTASIYTKNALLSALTLKWSRGVPMDPKISFRALARKRKVIGRRPSLTLSNFTLRFFWWQKICIDHVQVLLISKN